ncbi:unnamed protein product [Dovyalis caffra]|uniref:UBC core domain-containing protein n=1 Tax=Dovyalis caffra TaxID=77055 RepID=A0AAV1SC15_9ROSI|nr:unnamed protein product [Dovyalis caffra]
MAGLLCYQQVYHPNIDLEGSVCLNILREDWKPILNINIIVYGLFHLFMQPNHEDPMNSDAANVLRDDLNKFKSNVKLAMGGGSVGELGSSIGENRQVVSNVGTHGKRLGPHV